MRTTRGFVGRLAAAGVATVLGIAGLMANSSLVAADPSATPAPTPSPTPTGPPPGPAPTPPPPDPSTAEASALRLAKRLGRHVEVAGSRSETGRAVATPQGTLVYESYSRPRWTRKDSAWRQIDVSLRRDGNVIAPVATLADVRFSAGGSDPLATLSGADGSLRLSWPNPLPTPRIEADTAVYEAVLPDVDLRAYSTVDGFGYVLVVKNQAAAANPALAELRLGLAATGWSVRAGASGGFEAVDAAGNIVASAGQALMWDAAGVPASQRSATEAGTESLFRYIPDMSRKAMLPTTVEGNALVVVPDQPMLTAPETVYPVVIDPWTTIGKTRWGYTGSSNATRDDGVVRVGNDPDGSGIYRSFFSFNLSNLAGKTVRSVKFVTEMTHSWSCTDSPVSLYRSQDLTTSGKQTWDGPNLEVYLDQRWGHAHKGSGGCSDDPQPDKYMEFTSAALKSDLVSNGQGTTNYTLALSTRDSDGTYEGTTSRWKKFDASLTKLTVEYNTNPHTPPASYLTTHADYTAPGQPCVTGTGRPLVRSVTPWLKAAISDPDGGTLSGSFALQRWDGAAWAAVTGWPKVDAGVPNGGKAEVQIPAGSVAEGLLRWQVQVTDPLGGASNWSVWCEFDLDITPPGATPSVTSADGVYIETPPNDVLRGGVGRTGQFTLAANGATDVFDYEYQLDGGPPMYAKPATLGGSVTVSVTPTHRGENVLTVRSRDQAQNKSAPYDYVFLVDVPSLPTSLWNLDEGSGTTLATDPAGGPTATMTNGPTWVDGRVPGTHITTGKDHAVTFDGVDDHAATASPVLDTSKSFSVAAWVKLTTRDSFRSVLCQEGTSACSFALQYSPAPVDRWVLDMYSGDVNNPTITRVAAATTPSLNLWTHLAATWDAGTQTARLYVNGVLAGSATLAQNWNSAGPLLFGRARYNGNPVNHFSGEIAEVRVWNRVVYPEVDLQPLVQPILAGAWEMEDFDEETPRQVSDESGYQNPLTLTDAPSTTWCDGYNFSGGLCFDGTTGAAVTATPALRTDQAYTVSTWLRYDGTDSDGTRTAVAQEGTSVSSFFVGCRTSSGQRWALMNAEGLTFEAEYVLAPNLCAPGVWTHVVGVFDPAAGQQRLYVNGMQVASGPMAPAWQARTAFTIGRAKWGSPVDFWIGGIDRVRIWQGILTSDEITALYQEP